MSIFAITTIARTEQDFQAFEPFIRRYMQRHRLLGIGFVCADGTYRRYRSLDGPLGDGKEITFPFKVKEPQP